MSREEESEIAESESDSDATEPDPHEQPDDSTATTTQKTGPESATEPAEKAQIDTAAESFVEVEQELGHLEVDTIRGQAIDVAKVAASRVPGDFPYDITTDHALELTLVLVDSGETTIQMYFDWPETEPDERLATLLELKDIAPDRFADLHGAEILLTRENNHYVPVLPDEPPRGDERAIYGIFAGIAPSLIIAMAGIFGASGLVANSAFLLVWLLFTFIVLPISIYLDAWHLRTTTDWDGGPLFWTFFSIIPGLNVLMVPAYLIMRENAQPVI